MDESFNFGWVDGGGCGLGWVGLGLAWWWWWRQLGGGGGGGGNGLCGWPDFFVPCFGGCGFCELVVGNLMVVWVVG